MSSSSARSTGASLEVRQLCMHFGGIRALDELNLSVEAGEVLGLIGPNGSGKSTLINCISGVLTPTSGVITLQHTDITRWSRRQRARFGLIRTYQNLRIFNGMTAAENVEVAARLVGSATHPRLFASDVLRDQDLAPFARRRVSDLAYGTQRKIEVARALAATPRLLALDEPAAGLGEDDTHRLIETIQRFRESSGATVLLVDHDMHLVSSVCDRIVVLHQGQILTEGKPSQVLSDPRVAEVYLGTGAKP